MCGFRKRVYVRHVSGPICAAHVYPDAMSVFKPAYMNNLEVIISAAQDKKAKGIVSLDMRGIDGAICEKFVICNADSTTHVDAISGEIEDKLIEVNGEKPLRVEGRENSYWVVMDYGDVMVHIFLTEAREYYRLEELWGDVPVTEYESYE